MVVSPIEGAVRMTQVNQAALVYAPCASDEARVALREVLFSEGLFSADTQEELPRDMSLPPDERPVLVRQVLLAGTAQPVAFVTDDVGCLGRTPAEQTAVLLALKARVPRIIVD